MYLSCQLALLFIVSHLLCLSDCGLTLQTLGKTISFWRDQRDMEIRYPELHWFYCEQRSKVWRLHPWRKELTKEGIWWGEPPVWGGLWQWRWGVGFCYFFKRDFLCWNDSRKKAWQLKWLALEEFGGLWLDEKDNELVILFYPVWVQDPGTNQLWP